MDWLPAIAILVLICPCYVTNSGGLIINPDVTAITGESANFTCSTQDLASHPVDWYHLPVGRESRIHIYSEKGGGFRSEYQSNFVAVNDNDRGIYHLLIKSVATSLAGTFSCMDNNGHGTTAGSELIVIDHSPTCQINREVFIGDNDCGITPDSIDLTCDVPYFGYRPPRLTWKYKNGTDFNQPALNQTVPLKVTLPADTVRDGESFVCHVESTPHRCATDDIKIPQMKSKVVHKQEDFICLESPTTHHCNNFQQLLSNDSSGIEPALRICSAKCTIRNISCLVTLLRFYSEQDTKESTIIIGIVVTVSLGCFFILLAIGVFAYRKKWLCFKPRPVTNMVTYNGTSGTSQYTNATTDLSTQLQTFETAAEVSRNMQGYVKNRIESIDKLSKMEQPDTSTSGRGQVGKNLKKQAKGHTVSLEIPHLGDSTSDTGHSTEKHCDGLSLHGEDHDPASAILPTGVATQSVEEELPSNYTGASKDDQNSDPAVSNDPMQPSLLPGDDPNHDDKELHSNDKEDHDDGEDRDPEAGDDSMQPLLPTGDDAT